MITCLTGLSRLSVPRFREMVSRFAVWNFTIIVSGIVGLHNLRLVGVLAIMCVIKLILSYFVIIIIVAIGPVFMPGIAMFIVRIIIAAVKCFSVNNLRDMWITHGVSRRLAHGSNISLRTARADNSTGSG